MGREVKRVPADFDWPLDKVWTGYQMPDDLLPLDCPECECSGYNEATRKIQEDWYDQQAFGVRWWYDYKTGIDGQPAGNPPWKVFGDCRRWCHSLTQDEVDALVDAGRLWDLTRGKPEGYRPTADEVNHWSHYGFGHDAINRHICVEVRAKRLGVYGDCYVCKGEGHLWRYEGQKEAYDAWTRTHPPTGEAYQIWETVTEGSPISPPFLKPEDLAAWMVKHPRGMDRETTYEQWLAFIRRGGSAPSLVVDGGRVMQGVEAVTREDVGK